MVKIMMMMMMMMMMMTTTMIMIGSTSEITDARLSGPTAELVFNSKIDGAVPLYQAVIGRVGVYGRNVSSVSYKSELQ